MAWFSLRPARFDSALRRLTLLFCAVSLLACTGCLTNYAVGPHPEWRKLVASPEEFDLVGETVRFTSRDGLRLTGWWLSSKEDAKGTVILVHGQGGNRSHMLRRASLCVRNGYHVLDIDLRAHGESEGNYMTPGYLEALDVLGAVKYVRERDEATPIVLFGYSYGAVAVLHAAAESSEPAAVIADAAFILSDMMDRLPRILDEDPDTPTLAKLAIGLMRVPGLTALARLEFWLLTGVDMDPKKAEATHAVERIGDTPLLFLAGENDPIAPPETVQQLYNALSTKHKAMITLAGATHRTLTDETQEKYERAIISFLNWYLHGEMHPPSES